jgi:hypothetical protein
MEYKEIKETKGSCIVRTDDDGTMTAIPIDPANSDYQAYLAQLEESED